MAYTQHTLVSSLDLSLLVAAAAHERQLLRRVSICITRDSICSSFHLSSPAILSSASTLCLKKTLSIVS